MGINKLAQIDSCIDAFLNELRILQNNIESKEASNNIFIPTLIAQSLWPAREYSTARDIAYNILTDLKSCRSKTWTWNYLGPDRSIYPDDLDDTGCALAALLLWDGDFVTGQAIKCFTGILIHNEVVAGGPYYTWIMSPETECVESARNDIDLVVNSNIAYALSLIGVQTPAIDYFIEQQLEERGLISQYYPNQALILYFIARAYRGDKSHELIRRIVEIAKANHQNHFILSLALSSIIRLKADTAVIEDLYSLLLAKTENPSTIGSEIIYIEKISDKGIEYAKSRALALAVRIEALCLLKEHILMETRQTLMKNIRTGVIRGVNGSPFLSTQIKRLVILEINKLEYTAPYTYTELLLLPHSISCRSDGMTRPHLLSEVSILFWIMYTIDDCIMDIGDNIVSLPLSRSISRHVHNALQATLTTCPVRVRRQVMGILNLTDETHMSECRRESVHPIKKSACLTIPARIALGKYEKEFDQCLYHYIMARQLSDDAHDWEDDLHEGRVTDITKTLLKTRTEHQASGQVIELRELFWSNCAESVALQIIHHTEKARFFLKKCAFPSPVSESHFAYLAECINRYGDSAQAMYRDVMRTKEFLKTQLRTD